MKRLSEKWALVTGSVRDMGQQIAIGLAHSMRRNEQRATTKQEPNAYPRRQVLVALGGLMCVSFNACGGSSASAESPASPGMPTATLPPPVASAEFASAGAIVSAMAAGFNLGNTFDLGLHSTQASDIYPLIDLYQTAGMRHIRIPVTWMEPINDSVLADATGLVNAAHPRLVQLKAVVDYALSKGLYVVLNTHHEHWLYKRYDGSQAMDSIFSRLWTGIAAQFADYPERLIFEVLNEPQGVFGDWNGGLSPNPSNARALELTRRINQVGYDAIRASAGLNAKRLIMVGTNGMGNHTQLRLVYPAKTDLPGGGIDPHLAIQVHTYDPWGFCGQDGSNAAWPGERAISDPILAVLAHARTLGVPINYGEYGVGRKTNTAERDTDVVRSYYRLVTRTVLQKGMSTTVWDDRGWFGLTGATNAGGFALANRIVQTMLSG